MTKEKLYKVVRNWQAYSKKKGSVPKRSILVKNLTEVELNKYLELNFPGKTVNESGEFKVEGFIYPETIQVIR